MNKDKEKIFSHSGCLSLEEILKYVQDRSTLKERHQVERHLLDCVLCQDAVEGYAMMEEKEKAAGIMLEIDRHYGNKETDWFDIRKIAAGVAVIIMFCAGLYYVNTTIDPTSQQVLQEQHVPPGSPDIENSKEKPSDNQNETIALEEKKEEKVTIENEAKVPAPDAAGKEAAVTQVKPSKKYSYSISGSGVSNYGFHATIPEGESQSKSLAMDTHNLKDQIEHTSRQPVAVTSPETKIYQWAQSNEGLETGYGKEKSSVGKSNSRSVDKKSKAQSNSSPAPVMSASGTLEEQAEKDDLSVLQEGIRQYDQKKYKEASEIFEGILISDPGNEEARYYNGLSYLELGDWEKAVKNFDHVKAGAGYYEGAQWSKASALLKNGDKANAKIILKEIAGRPGPNQQKAGEMLKNID